MTKTIKINGMMCSHCENRVRKCLMEIDGVIDADVSSKNGTAVVNIREDVSDELLKNTIEAQDYEVVSIE